MRTLREAGVDISSLSDIDHLLESHADVIEAWADRVAAQLEQAVLSGIVWLDPGRW
jgi:hypothetical protein